MEITSRLFLHCQSRVARFTFSVAQQLAKNTLTWQTYFGLSLLLVFGQFLSLPVHAQTTVDAIQVEPIYQELTIEDGVASISGQLQLTNATAVDQNFEVFAVDIKQFDANGQVVLADKPISGTQFSLAQFISLPTPNYTAKSGEKISIPFFIRDSTELSPGGHYAVLVARLTTQAAAVGTQQVLPAISSFVLVRKVGGELYNVSLKQLSFASRSLLFQVPTSTQLHLSNQGNTHIIPRGTVEFHDLFGRITHRGIINENSVFVFPGTERELTVPIRKLKQAWPFMLYTVHVTGRADPGNAQFSQSASLVILDPFFLVLVLVILFMFMFLLRKILKRRKSLRHANEKT